jgi:hypothetical protein
MRMKALQSLMAGNSAAKSLGPVPSPGPGERLRTTLFVTTRARRRSRDAHRAGERLRTTLFVTTPPLQKSGGETCTPRRWGWAFSS